MITSEAVEEIFNDCLFKEEELVDGKPNREFTAVEGLVHKVGFHPDRIISHKDEIITLLNELNDNFHQGKGGGWSFLNACVDKNDNQWGEQMNVEQLVMLGIAIKRVQYAMPREMWSMFPGGVPFFTISDKDILEPAIR
jgi:hypothetical protein